jgi:dipeptide/tripeptide permease
MATANIASSHNLKDVRKHPRELHVLFDWGVWKRFGFYSTFACFVVGFAFH